MTAGRTEEAALSGFLEVSIGGSPVRLRALNLDESDAWLVLYADAMARTEVMDGDTSREQMYSLVTQGSRDALALVIAYDLDHVLGDDLRRRATKAEIAAALEQMVTVEDPLASSAGRLAAAVFGLPSQLAAERMEAVTEPMLRLVRSLSTPSGPGASATGPSEAGPASSSSSTGRMRRTATAATPATAAS